MFGKSHRRKSGGTRLSDRALQIVSKHREEVRKIGRAMLAADDEAIEWLLPFVYEGIREQGFEAADLPEAAEAFEKLLIKHGRG